MTWGIWYCQVSIQRIRSEQGGGILINGERGTGNKHGERENKKWGLNLTFILTLSVTLFSILCFVPTFYFSIPRARFPLPIPRLGG